MVLSKCHLELLAKTCNIFIGLSLVWYVVVANNAQSISIVGRGLIEESTRHKDLFPMDASDYAGTFLVGVGLMIAASGGIGGGGILVPLLIIVYQFHPKYAIPLSNFTILGSSLTNMVLNLPKIHPDADRPLVDWDLILVMEPLTMAGAVVGAIVGKILPDWILVVSLVVLLAYTTYTTLEKAISQYKKETASMEAAKKSFLVQALEEVEDSETEAQETALLAEARSIEKKELVDKFPVDPELTTLLEQESRTPMDKVFVLSMMVVVVVGLNLLKGGSGNFPSPLGIKCGSQSYWVVTGIVFFWIILNSLWARNELIKKWKLKQRLQYKYIAGDVEWNPKNTVIYPLLCFFAGFFAGMFGVGGGIVKGPLMLQMGVHPLVASATTAVMIMFTSVAATTMFVAFGTLTWDYAVFLFVVGLVTTSVGQFGVSYLVNKYKRFSLISFSIGAVVAISTVLMAVQSIFSLMEAQENVQAKVSLC